MLARNVRRIVFLAALAALFLAVRAWRHDAPAPPVSLAAPAKTRATEAARDAPRAAVTPSPRAIAADPVASSGTARETARSLSTIPRRQAAVHLDAHAPIDVRVGDVFEARIFVDASAPLRDLAFAVVYEKSRLGLVRRSEGEFVRQPGIRAEYGIDEPSDGYVGVVFKAVEGSFATGAGNVVVLEFEALRPGTSRIELQNVKCVDVGGEVNRNIVVTHASVTIH